ncbi:Cytosolic Fe-S cluster assembly factor nubp1 [Portunus trituberculatus]|uniref:Cytosolic Fe-S cluster assembly factor nubp1 n=1 Tax=Portunus trituberculatus TaxID=210409 RepID=A0A5B7HXN7_PORTR|nr:Cytosolic Fe-S cluster assembly factor nubp1 [Portunus trituberculatus]
MVVAALLCAGCVLSCTGATTTLLCFLCWCLSCIKRINEIKVNIKNRNDGVWCTDLAVVRERLASVKNKVLVLSGKGGVGKSTVSAMLGRALALDDSKEVSCSATLGVTLPFTCVCVMLVVSQVCCSLV